jgi:hypothetical protein
MSERRIVGGVPPGIALPFPAPKAVEFGFGVRCMFHFESQIGTVESRHDAMR